MPHTDFLHCSIAEWSVHQAAETIRTWQQLVPWGLATSKMSGTQLFEQGSTPREVFLLERGLIKLNCALPDGQQVILSLRLPGQLVGGTRVHLLGERYTVSAIAATECRVSCISIEAMQRELRRNTEVAQFLLRQQALDIHNQAVALIEAKSLNTSERFAQFVRHLAAVFEPHNTRRPTRLTLPLSDTEVASLLGVTKEYFSRLKRQLEAEERFHWKDRTLVIF